MIINRNRLAAALTGLALTALVPAAPARAEGAPCPRDVAGGSPSTSVDYRLGGLSEAVLLVRVPVARVRHLVPPRYRLLDEAGGTASVVAAHGSVTALEVGCGDPRPATVSEYGVMVESPDGTPGRHAYYLWQLSDDRQLVARMRMLGMQAAEYADGSFLERTAPAGRVDVLAREAWDGQDIGMEAKAAEPVGGPGATLPGVRFWFDGPRGTVRTAYTCPDCRPRTPATGSVWGSGDSVLDTILGGAAATGSGFFIRTDLVATAELLDPLRR